MAKKAAKKTTKKASKKSSANASSKDPSPKSQPKSSEVEVRHPKIIFQLFQKTEGKRPFTREDARTLLGWSEPPKGVTDGVVTVGSEKVFCVNNAKNRLPDWTWVKTLAQEILTRKYRLNCQNIIIGRNGSVVTGQHRLYALELACQEWHAHPDKWLTYWEEEPWIETTVCFGCDESKEVLDTIDFAKPLSLADVVFRRGIFDDLKPNDRMKCARMCADAIKLLWTRTGAAELALTPRRTHAESTSFIERHSRLLDAVRHVYEEDEGRKISRYIPAGYTAGLMYLFGVSATERETDNGDGYHQLDLPDESALDFSRWDAANDFVVALAFGNQPGGKAVHGLVEQLGREFEEGMEPWVIAERIALTVKAWNLYAEGKDVKADDIELLTVEDSEGQKFLAEDPVCGGIDLGSGKIKDVSEE